MPAAENCASSANCRSSPLTRPSSRAMGESWRSRSPLFCLAYAPNGRSLITGHPDGTILIWSMTPPVRPVSAEDLPRLWADLAGADAGRAYEATWQLTDGPEQALVFLKKHLRPAVPA